MFCLLFLVVVKTPLPSLMTEWFSVIGLVHSKPSSQGPDGSIPNKWGPEGRSHSSPSCCKVYRKTERNNKAIFNV